MEKAEGNIDYAQARGILKSSFLLRKYMGRPVLLRPGSNHRPALDMLSAVANTVGREVHVFVNPAALPAADIGSSMGPETDMELDDYYEFTSEDYARMMAHKKQDVFLKTRKIREEEEAARRARFTKATVRVQFPDNYVLEAVFQPSDPLALLYDLLQKVILQENLAFCLYTSPPRKQIKDLQQSMYAAGLTPGGLVYFSLDSGQAESAGPFLSPEIAALRDLHLLESPVVHQEPANDPAPGAPDQSATPSNAPSDQQKQVKRPGGKPKWFKQR